MNVNTAPHIFGIDNTSGIMLDVIIALLPATIAGICFFGFNALLVVAVSVASAVAAEYLWCVAIKKETTIRDLSAIVTGLILALNLPPTLPCWMAAVGSAVAIIIVKQMFGGLGYNFANPAISARIVLMVSFPTAMTTFIVPFSDSIISSATPLADAKAAEGGYELTSLFLGNHPGCIGETSALLLLAGGIYLVLRKVITVETPLSFMASAALLALVLGQDPIRTVLTGGIMLGSIFMATDYVTTPPTRLGKIVFGVGAGFLTVIIRQGNIPEGVSFAILLMNIVTPYINRLTAKKPFGAEVKADE